MKLNDLLIEKVVPVSGNHGDFNLYINPSAMKIKRFLSDTFSDYEGRFSFIDGIFFLADATKAVHIDIMNSVEQLGYETSTVLNGYATPAGREPVPVEWKYEQKYIFRFRYLGVDYAFFHGSGDIEIILNKVKSSNNILMKNIINSGERFEA